MHDAQGNVLSTYQVVQTRNNNKIVESVVQERVYMYGSSRLGELQTGNTVVRSGTFPYQATKPYDGKGAYNRSGGFLLRAQPGSSSKLEWYTGLKNYELTNHLGNVVSTVTDRKKGSVGAIGVNTTFGTPFGGTFTLPTTLEAVLHWIPEVTSATDYYPFGSQMPGRSFSSDSYRYGFQGQEMDNEVKGVGNSVNYKYRMQDTRLGRFFAVDPIAIHFPMLSPYQHSSLNPIGNFELEGLEGVQYNKVMNIRGESFVVGRIVEIDVYVAVSQNTESIHFTSSDLSWIKSSYKNELSNEFKTANGLPVEFIVNIQSFDADVTSTSEKKASLLREKNNYLYQDFNRENGFRALVLEKGDFAKPTIQGGTEWMHIILDKDAINGSHTLGHETIHAFLKYDEKYSVGNSVEGHNDLDGILRYTRDGLPVQEPLNEGNVIDVTNTVPISRENREVTIETTEDAKGL